MLKREIVIVIYTNAFSTYVTQVLVPQLWTGACVVMDNFSSHKVAGIKEAIGSISPLQKYQVVS